MSLPSDFLYAVTRLRSRFADGLNEPRVGFGTGFWLHLPGDVHVFVTNKHNVDPSISFPKDQLRLDHLSLELRRHRGDEALIETRFFDVDPSAILVHPTADVALVRPPSLPEADASGDEPFTIVGLPTHMLADTDWFHRHVSLTSMATFIGFPGNGKEHWFDQMRQTPIARLATVASDPRHPFINARIPTANVGLVSGLSFTGSSGSPLIVHERREPFNFGITSGRMTVPPQIIGIMSGHFRERVDEEPEMFRHTGLSYFTRSDSILDLLRTIVPNVGDLSDQMHALGRDP